MHRKFGHYLLSDIVKSFSKKINERRRSLSFVKSRIKEGYIDGYSLTQIDTIDELPLKYALDMFDPRWVKNFLSSGCLIKSDTDLGELTVSVKYNPLGDFEYCTMERCRNDGTFVFYRELIERNIMKIFCGQTYNSTKLPKDFYDHIDRYEMNYEIGDLVLASEYSSKFATKEKPWMRSRFTVFMPIKMSFKMKKDDKLAS